MLTNYIGNGVDRPFCRHTHAQLDADTYVQVGVALMH